MELIKELFEDFGDKYLFEDKTYTKLNSSIKKPKHKHKLKDNIFKFCKRQNSPIKIKDPHEIISNSKYKYTTIKITDELYYSIDKWGYIFLDKNSFIPNTTILGLVYRDNNSNIRFKLSPTLKLSNKKISINERIKHLMSEDVYKNLNESNEYFSKFIGKKLTIPFILFEYDYYIEYFINKHEISIQIYDKNSFDVTNKFNLYKREINSWVIHKLERYNKDFYIERLKYHLKRKNEELLKYKHKYGKL